MSSQAHSEKRGRIMKEYTADERRAMQMYLRKVVDRLHMEMDFEAELLATSGGDLQFLRWERTRKAYSLASEVSRLRKEMYSFGYTRTLRNMLHIIELKIKVARMVSGAKEEFQNLLKYLDEFGD